MSDTVTEGIVRERAVATDLHASPDGQEGFHAFVERRKPEFGKQGRANTMTRR